MADSKLTARRYSAPAIRKFCVALLTRIGLPPRDAAVVADALVLADLRGITSHGVNLLPHYVERIVRGTINPVPKIQIEDLGPAVARVDGNGGMGQVALSAATEEAIRKAAQAGVGWVCVKNTNHCGALPYFGLRLAEAGMIGIVLTHTDAAVVPFGATEPFLGTNPICITFPGRSQRIICIDFATSAVAWNKILEARAENHSVPIGWGIDANGNDASDPNAIIALYPFGGHKGSALAVAIDLLSALLSRAHFGADMAPMYAVGSKRRLGAVVCAVNVSAFANLKEVRARTNSYITRLHALKPQTQSPKVFYPGEPESIMMRQNLVSGIRLPRKLVHQFRELAKKYKVRWSLVDAGRHKTPTNMQST
jgi:ureidoglycolate dehydrogenase (NAD+)